MFSVSEHGTMSTGNNGNLGNAGAEAACWGHGARSSRGRHGSPDGVRDRRRRGPRTVTTGRMRNGVYTGENNYNDREKNRSFIYIAALSVRQNYMDVTEQKCRGTSVPLSKPDVNLSPTGK